MGSNVPCGRGLYIGSQGDSRVEVAACADSVHIRDSKVAAGPELSVTPGSWAAFVGGVTGA
ncbi:DUF397 domain-containing protein [Streptomyces sp. H27-H1]|uniref:DUF397 domain-containing protein n=1 Tax=Streptomyces sp. H27-H1 TaxID=2996461 RepID=UPI002D1E37E6|nr:DUF397 domain-containing protein [Streptomyces sp. H27-H1]